MMVRRWRRRTGGPLCVDFITVGDESHGVTRYSRIVARGVSAAGADVWEHRLSDHPSMLSLAGTALRARTADVVHVQLTTQYWGKGRRQFWAALVLRVVLVGQPLVVTAHDFHTPRRYSPRNGWLRWLPRRLPADDAASRLLLGTADLVLTCSQAEVDVLAWTRPRRTAVIDHFIEERLGAGAHEPSFHPREGLLVLGYIHRRKGQLHAVRALQHLPDEHLVIAGTANERNSHYVEEIQAEAEATGVSGRVRMTGYLAEAELDEVLAHARVGLAPYEKIAASGSLATLAAAGVPIVARRHAYLHEMALACPRGVHLYDGDDSALADTIRECLAHPIDVQRAELLEWAACHSPVKTGMKHLEQYSSVVTRGQQVAAAVARS